MLLTRRSIILQICLFVLIRDSSCQSYDYGTEDGDDYHEESNLPDYSKYYSTDTSAPLVTGGDSENAGFTSPLEFSGFYSPIELGASQKKETIKSPFKADNFGFPYESSFPKDYFEEAQKQQQTRDEESYRQAPDPSYISQHVPTEVDDKPIKYTKPIKTEAYTVPKYSDYTIGKSSSTVGQYPQAPGLYESFKSSTPTPYQKYSFQPIENGGTQSKYLASLISTVAPFNPAYTKISSTASTPLYETESSEHIPSQLKGKNCRRVKKSINHSDRSKRDAMNCYVCDDPGNKSKYTHCSYAEESEPVDYRESHSERYSSSPENSRYKRYSGDEYNSDPYEYIKSRSRGAYSEPKKEDYDEFVPHYSDAPDKSFSEVEAEQLKADPVNCVKESKDGMTCTICKDPKTGGNFEQCSYTSAPKEQKYAYVTEKKYDSNKDPEEASESKPVKETKEALNGASKDKHKNFNPKAYATNSKPTKKLINDEPYEIPKHFAEGTVKQEKHQRRGLDPELYGSADSSEADEKDSTEEQIGEYKDHVDEYHYRLFPEHKEESKQEQVIRDHPADNSREDVEKVLAEFSKKDRSACKKAEKSGMTCYLCVDEKGIQHEECMYVSESKPQASHVAYHEVKQIKSPNNDNIHRNDDDSDDDDDHRSAPTNIKRKRFFKKANTESPIALVEAASEDIDSKIKLSKKQPVKSKRKIVKKSTKLPNDRSVDGNEPTQKTPAEFEVGPEEGAFSSETRPVYSKKYGTKLPKYMIEKSEFEREFDADAYNN